MVGGVYFNVNCVDNNVRVPATTAAGPCTTIVWLNRDRELEGKWVGPGGVNRIYKSINHASVV